MPRCSCIVIALLCLLAACAGEAPAPEAAPPAPAAPADTAEVQTYAARGVVANVMASRKTLIIDHDAIEGYMAAMSMPFSVADTALLTGIAPMDSVLFRFDVSTGLGVIKEIEKIE